MPLGTVPGHAVPGCKNKLPPGGSVREGCLEQGADRGTLRCQAPSRCANIPFCRQQNPWFRTVLSKIFLRVAHALDCLLKIFWCSTLIGRHALLHWLSVSYISKITHLKTLHLRVVMGLQHPCTAEREWHITGILSTSDSFRAQVPVWVKANKQKTWDLKENEGEAEQSITTS